MFNVSDKVVCVDDSPGWVDEYWFPGGYVKEGETYVIHSINLVRGKNRDGVIVDWVGLVLVGLPAIRKQTNFDNGWESSRFRKLTDIQAENALRNAATVEGVR